MSLINVSNLTFSYEGSYDNIFENVSFQINTVGNSVLLEETDAVKLLS